MDCITRCDNQDIFDQHALKEKLIEKQENKKQKKKTMTIKTRNTEREERGKREGKTDCTLTMTKKK